MSTTEDAIVDAAVSHDALVAGAARDLVADVILEIQHQLHHGTPANKMTILRAFASPLLRTASQQAESDEIAELRQMVMDMQKRMLGGPEKEDIEQEQVDLGDMHTYDEAMEDGPPGA